MKVTIFPSSVQGTIVAQPSKSHAQRVIAIAALAKGISEISGAGSSDDVRNALRVVESMGAMVKSSNDTIYITGSRPLFNPAWHCGESGLGIRMFSAIAGLFDTSITLTAEGSLSSRNMEFMAEPFSQLGVNFKSQNGFPPLEIKGPYRNPHVVMDSSASSQFLTGLLIALPTVDHDTVVEVRNLKSKPYIDLTIKTIHSFGVEVLNENYEKFTIQGNQVYQPHTLHVDGDWSGMAFLCVAAALCGQVIITGLPDDSTQADSTIIEALRLCGADVSTQDRTLIVQRDRLVPFELDCTHCPDLFPPLTALAIFCDGTSRIAGVHRLQSKESDRGVALISEFGKLGAKIRKAGDELVIEGGQLHGGTADARGDHRIAMALATAALKCTDAVTITRAESVSKSYPGFFNDLASIGGHVQYSDEK